MLKKFFYFYTIVLTIVVIMYVINLFTESQQFGVSSFEKVGVGVNPYQKNQIEIQKHPNGQISIWFNDNQKYKEQADLIIKWYKDEKKDSHDN